MASNYTTDDFIRDARKDLVLRARELYFDNKPYAFFEHDENVWGMIGLLEEMIGRKKSQQIKNAIKSFYWGNGKISHRQNPDFVFVGRTASGRVL